MKGRVSYLDANEIGVLEVGPQGPKVLGNRYFIAVVIRKLELVGALERNLLQNFGFRVDLAVLVIVRRDKADTVQKPLELDAVTI